jgi:ATP/maltotriose-dependent transcriptional regulator MalT
MHWFQIAAAEVPEGVNLVFLSRSAPRESLARFEIEGRMGTLGPDELRLDDAEALAVAGLSPGEPAPPWGSRADGWAAGLAILRGQAERDDDQIALSRASGCEALSRYFAAEFLKTLAPQPRRNLVLLSCLPDFTLAEAHQLTRDEHCGPFVQQLNRLGRFVTQCGTSPATYRLHPLLQDFLRQQLEDQVMAVERRTLHCRAGDLMQARGQWEQAAQQYVDGLAYESLAELLVTCAGNWIGSGRGAAWRTWADRLPLQLMESRPWILHWYGSSLNHVDPARGRRFLTRAAQAFEAQSDHSARWLAITALMDSYLYEWSDFHGLYLWMRTLVEEVDQAQAEAMSPELALRVHSRLTMALSLGDPFDASLPYHARSALTALPSVSDRSEQLAAGTLLLEYFTSVDRTVAEQLRARLALLATDPSVASFHRVWWFRPAALQCHLEGDDAQARALFRQGRQLAEEFGLPHLHCHFNARMAVMALSEGDLATAQQLLDDMQRILRPERRHDLVYLRMLELCVHAQRGDVDAAIEAGEDALLHQCLAPWCP